VKLEEYLQQFRRAIAWERRAEIEAMRQEIRALSPQEREEKGRALLSLSGRYLGREAGGFYLVRLGRPQPFGDLEIRVGDVVLVSRENKNPLKEGVEATVVELTSRSITVAFSDIPPRWVSGKGFLRVDLYVNDTTFRRMEEALLDLKAKSESLFPLKRVLLESYENELTQEETTFNPVFVDTELNPSQQEAVKRALNSSLFFLVHGPPGTGKTRTVVEYVVQEVGRGQKVLATADSNTACDNLLSGLVRRGVKAVRVGHPARVERELEEHSLFSMVKALPVYGQVEKLWEEVLRLRREQERHLKPFPQWRRGMEDRDILEAARKGEGRRGVPASKIASMARWLKVEERIRELVREAQQLENRAIQEVLNDAQVIVSTNIGSGVDILKDMSFDVVVIDEGSQATEPSCLVALLKGQKLVMSGDHLQLPPTILSEEARPILSKTLFERMMERYPEHSAFLNVQYRMNEKIMAFSNWKFYQGRLIAHPSVAQRTLSRLGISLKGNPRWRTAVDPELPLVFMDTVLCTEKGEKQYPGSTSYYNPLEARIVQEIVGDFLKLGVPEEWIGVITPYDDQVNLIRRNLPGVRVSTVDGFQGREKEIILLSLVRSNPKGEVGFLKDTRRLNVALTRACSKLVVIGDSATVSREEVYQEFIDLVKREGCYFQIGDSR
jgi:predicted DNA helicase